MGFEDLLEIGTIIKFIFLFVPLTVFVFMFAPTLKWKLLLTLGGFIGVITALSGSSLRRRT